MSSGIESNGGRLSSKRRGSPRVASVNGGRRSFSVKQLHAESFLRPRVAAHVIAVGFPEARAIPRHELDARDPLGAFPCVEPWHDQARRAAVLR